MAEMAAPRAAAFMLVFWSRTTTSPKSPGPACAVGVTVSGPAGLPFSVTWTVDGVALLPDGGKTTSARDGNVAPAPSQPVNGVVLAGAPASAEEGSRSTARQAANAAENRHPEVRIRSAAAMTSQRHRGTRDGQRAG